MTDRSDDDSRRVEKLGADRRLVWIGVNPTAGAGTRGFLVDELTKELQGRGFEVESTSDFDQLVPECNQRWAQGDLRGVISAGGDGTITRIVNELNPGVPVSVLRLGTENLLAKYLEIPADPIGLADLIEDGWTIPLDAGSANGRLFLLMLSCGFDADVVQRAHAQRKGNITHLHYAKPILDSLRNYSYPELDLQDQPDCESDASESEKVESSVPERARWVFVVNLPRYAGGLQLVPNAVGTDGMLDVCTFLEGNWWNGLRYLGGVVSGLHQNLPDCETFRTSGLRIEADGEVPYQLDGDPGGMLPVDIKVLPARIKCIVGADWLRQHGHKPSSC